MERLMFKRLKRLEAAEEALYEALRENAGASQIIRGIDEYINAKFAILIASHASGEAKHD
jgi:hypothetical protein